MERSNRQRASALLAAIVLAAGCSFTGLGSYDVPTCNHPLGTTSGSFGTSVAKQTPQLSYNGSAPAAAFVGSANCVEVASASGLVSSGSCLISNDYSPVQPYAVPIGTGFAVVAVATTAPNKQGQVVVGTFANNQTAPKAPGSVPATPAGAALPAIVGTSDPAYAWVSWYESPGAGGFMAVSDCAMTKAAPLKLALFEKVDGTSPQVDSAAITMTASATSVRPPALVLDGTTTLLASPDGDAVSLWAIDGTTAPSPEDAIKVPALANARAVALGTDGAGNLALVAELGCEPQAIGLVLGTLKGGFSELVTVAPAPSTANYQTSPTVAWVPDEGYWIVSWLSNVGSPHPLAQRFDTSGKPVGAVLDPQASLYAVTVTSSGSLFGYAAPTTTSGNLESVGLGCALGPGGSEGTQ